MADMFWDEIRAQYAELRKARSAAEVAAILSRERCPLRHTYGSPEAVPMDSAAQGFFAGSGGDDQVFDALDDAGWVTVWAESAVYYAMRAPDGSVITYCEGDVYTSDRKAKVVQEPSTEPPTVPPTGGRTTFYRTDDDQWARCTVLAETAPGRFTVEWEKLPAYAERVYDVPRGRLLWSEDPDGSVCYTDHAHDIEYKGECDMCGSDDVSVVRHVLPDVKRTKDMDPVDAARHVVDTGSALMVNGTLLDLFSASAITQIYDAGGPKIKEKLRAMTLVQAVTVCFKVINKLSN